MSPLSFIAHYITRLFFVIPSIIPAIFLMGFTEWFRRSRKPLWKNFLIASIVSAMLPALISLESVLSKGGDGQAGLVYFFLPFYTTALGLLSFLIGWIFFKNKTELNSRPKAYPILIPSILVLFFTLISMNSIYRETFLSIAENSSNVRELAYLLNKGKKDKDSGIIMFLAQNDNTPANILEEIGYSDFCSGRIYAASHPNTPSSVLYYLVNDENKYVRRNAQEELERRDLVIESSNVN